MTVLFRHDLKGLVFAMSFALSMRGFGLVSVQAKVLWLQIAKEGLPSFRLEV